MPARWRPSAARRRCWGELARRLARDVPPSGLALRDRRQQRERVAVRRGEWPLTRQPMNPGTADAAVREAAGSSQFPAQFDAVTSLASTSDCRSHSTGASGGFQSADYGILSQRVATRSLIDEPKASFTPSAPKRPSAQGPFSFARRIVDSAMRSRPSRTADAGIPLASGSKTRCAERRYIYLP